MIRCLHNITSVRKFFNRSTNGQMATILTLFMVGVLIFILVTVNVGSTGVKATVVRNAADSASLSIGSAVATRSFRLAETLKVQTKCDYEESGQIG